MIIWVSLWHSLSSVSPRRGVESFISVWDPLRIESRELKLNVSFEIPIE